MADKKTLTIALMDPPFETHRSTTAFRIMDIAARRGSPADLLKMASESDNTLVIGTR